MTDKELYGEIFTPISLVEKMCNLLPTSVWSNPDLYWLDPGCGPGNFSIYIQRKLAQHNTKSNLHMVEINPKSTFLLREIFKSYANIYEEDYLTWKTSLQFDIIIGNPPFNRYGLIKTPTSSLHKSHDGKTIWRDFIRKSLQLLKPNGYLCFIVPSIWMKPDREGIYNLLTQYKLHFIECFSNTKTNQYFGGRAQTPTCIFLLQKIPTDHKVDLWDSSFNKWTNYSLHNQLPIPVYGATIINKFVSKIDSSNQLTIIKTNMPSKTITITDNKLLPYKSILTCRLHKLTPQLIIKYTDVPTPYYDKKKLIMPHGMWGFPYCDIKGEFGICNRDKYVILSDDEERLNRLAQFFSTKTARYLFLATRYRMKLLEKYIFQLIPDITKLPDFPVEINDMTIQDYFSLDYPEREIIETEMTNYYSYQ